VGDAKRSHLSSIDFSNSIAQLCPVLKGMNQRLRWWKFIGAVVICAPIACGEQILPQLLAQMASLDPDHRVSLHACGDGVDFVITHDGHSSPENDECHAFA
jgi:hypothetical protein